MPTLFQIIKYTLPVTGILLFLVSLSIEGLVLSSMLGTVVIGFGFALALELAKVITVLAKPLLHAATGRESLAVSVSLPALRAGLVLISVACSTTYLALHIDRPYLERVRAADLAAVNQEISAKRRTFESELDTSRKADLARVKQVFDTNSLRLEKQQLPLIRDLEKQLKAEMDNVVKGEFIGKRYKEFERRLLHAQAQYDAELKQYTNEYQQQLTMLNQQYDTRLVDMRKQVEETEKQRLNSIHTDNYANDERVSLPLIRAARQLLNGAFRLPVSDLVIGLMFALILALVAEIALYCVFSHTAELLSAVLIAQYSIWHAEVTGSLHSAQTLNNLRRSANQKQSELRSHREAMEERLRASIKDIA